MKNNWSWGDEMLSSLDIIARHEELQDEFSSLEKALEEAQSDFRFKSNSDESSLAEYQDAENTVAETKEALDEFNQSFDKDELDTLTEVISKGEDASDWSYGETLILDSYFEEYITNLINDCWEMPKEINSGEWPWRHFKLDVESAAAEALSDYSDICVDGETYHIRA